MMKLLFDLFPVVLFFLAYMGGENRHPRPLSAGRRPAGGRGRRDRVQMQQAPILLATAVAIVATAAQVGWLLARGRKVDRMLWISLAIIVVMGGATLWLARRHLHQVEAHGAILGIRCRIAGRRVPVRTEPHPRNDGEAADPSGRCLARLNLSWAAFFILMGAINLFVAYRFSESTWVNFKLFGGIGLMVVFVLVQGMYLSRYVQADGPPEAEDGK